MLPSLQMVDAPVEEPPRPAGATGEFYRPRRPTVGKRCKRYNAIAPILTRLGVKNRVQAEIIAY